MRQDFAAEWVNGGRGASLAPGMYPGRLLPWRLIWAYKERLLRPVSEEEAVSNRGSMLGSGESGMPIQGRWRNPALRRCDGKKAYRTSELAERIAEKRSIKTGELIISYKCFDCSAYHVGHADESQKAARRVHEPPSLPVLCPRCSRSIPEQRRTAALQTGSTTVYCSTACQQKWSRKKRHARRTALESPE